MRYNYRQRQHVFVRMKTYIPLVRRPARRFERTYPDRSLPIDSRSRNRGNINAQYAVCPCAPRIGVPPRSGRTPPKYVVRRQSARRCNGLGPFPTAAPRWTTLKESQPATTCPARPGRRPGSKGPPTRGSRGQGPCRTGSSRRWIPAHPLERSDPRPFAGQGEALRMALKAFRKRRRPWPSPCSRAEQAVSGEGRSLLTDLATTGAVPPDPWDRRARQEPDPG